MKNVWLKPETHALLDEAKIKAIGETKEANLTYDATIRRALKLYLKNG